MCRHGEPYNGGKEADMERWILLIFLLIGSVGMLAFSAGFLIGAFLCIS